MNGLLQRDLDYIYEALEHFVEIDSAILFGSRAMGNYKKGSDVDLALVGNEITNQTLCRVSDYLNEEYPLPYFFDLVDYNHIMNEELKRHIDTQGEVLYTKQGK